MIKLITFMLITTSNNLTCQMAQTPLHIYVNYLSLSTFSFKIFLADTPPTILFGKVLTKMHKVE